MCSLEDKKIGSQVAQLMLHFDDLTLVRCDCTLYMEDLRLFLILGGVHVLAGMGLSLFKPSPQIQPKGSKLRSNGPASLQNVQINE